MDKGVVTIKKYNKIFKVGFSQRKEERRSASARARAQRGS